MSASLSGDGFTVRPEGTVRQFIETSNPTLWSWQVVPIKEGRRPLILRVSIILKTPDFDAEKEYQVIEKYVVVDVGLRNRLQAFGLWAADHAQWLWSLITPWLFLRLRKWWRGFRRRAAAKTKKRKAIATTAE
jgi:hypothetical protein